MKNPIGQTLKLPKMGCEAFIPADICKIKFEFTEAVLKKAHDAALVLGQLNGVSRHLPDIDFFLSMYIRKDATHSSNIEGTQATLIDSVADNAGVKKSIPEDVVDINQYIKAMHKGFSILETLPISSRFIRTLHKELMFGGRESHHSDPGHFRASQNWIGGASIRTARFVPPPPSEVENAMSCLEKFIHRQDTIPPLIKAGLIHSHFETIHPFLDGNGRSGRLLITFYLNKEKLLQKPILFLSSFFWRHRQSYYDCLDNYRRGDYLGWIDFFLSGVEDIANESIATIDKITELRERDMQKIMTLSKRASTTALKIYPNLFALPIVSVAQVAQWSGLTHAGAQGVIDRFIEMGILKLRNPDKKYGRFYEYTKYLKVFATD